jgi:hypothetical protein
MRFHRRDALLCLQITALLFGCGALGCGADPKPDPTPKEEAVEADSAQDNVKLEDRKVEADQHYKDSEAGRHYVRFVFRDGTFAGFDGEGRPKVPPLEKISVEPDVCVRATWIPLRQETDHFGEVSVSSGPFFLVVFEGDKGNSAPDSFSLRWSARGGAPSQTIEVSGVDQARETNNLVEEFALYRKNIVISSKNCK